MRIAIVGSGIAGLGCAYLLSRRHAVTLFEAGDHFGGHTHTHEIQQGETHYTIDTGFIVHNPVNYPLLTRMFAELGVRSQRTTMSFSVRNDASGLEYSAATLDALFCQRRNLLSPRFLGMLRDLVRFYREAPTLLLLPPPGPTLGEYLKAAGYGVAFRDEHLLPMASALWSAPPMSVLEFPLQFVVRFMANHRMLSLTGRPQWLVVRGGSCTYVEALRSRWRLTECLHCPVQGMRRERAGVWVESAAGIARFDQVVLACHSDQALALLEDASEREREVLGAIPYQTNEVLLHTDVGLLPRNRKAWAAWNARVPAAAEEPCSVSYCMNLLQDFTSADPFIVTLNGRAAVAPQKILRRLSYAHPVYTHSSMLAQRHWLELQGRQRTWFAGAYWGWGFHEDGLRSAVEVCRLLGVPWEKSSGRVTRLQPRTRSGLCASALL